MPRYPLFQCRRVQTADGSNRGHPQRVEGLPIRPFRLRRKVRVPRTNGHLPLRFARGRKRLTTKTEPLYPPPNLASTARSSSATMLVILIIGFTAGPAVSL